MRRQKKKSVDTSKIKCHWKIIKLQEKPTRQTRNIEFEVVQKRVNLVDLEKMLQNEPSVQKRGFDTAENGPSKVWAASNQPPKALGSNEHLCQHSRGIHHRSLPLQKFPA